MNNESDPREIFPGLTFVSYVIVAPIILVAGIILNIWGLTAVKKSRITGVTQSYLLALGMSNVAVMICSSPVVYHLYAYQDYLSYCRNWLELFSQIHLEIPLANSLMTFSVYVIVCMTVERFYSVCKPAEFRKVHQTSMARNALLASALIAFMTQLPLAFRKTTSCTWDPQCLNCSMLENETVTLSPWWRAYIWLNEILSRFLPCLVLCVLNVFIIIKFRHVVRKRQNIIHPPGPKMAPLPVLPRAGNVLITTPEEKRLIRLLWLLMVIFIFSTMPMGIMFVFLSEARAEDYVFQLFRALANNLELFNFSSNLFVFCVCSSELRKLMWSCTCRKPN